MADTSNTISKRPDSSNPLPTDRRDLVIVGRRYPDHPVVELGEVTPPLTAAEWVEFFRGERAIYSDNQPMRPGYTDVRVAERHTTWEWRA